MTTTIGAYQPIIEVLVEMRNEGHRWVGSLPPGDWRLEELRKLAAEYKVSLFSSPDEMIRLLISQAQDANKKHNKCFAIRPWQKSDHDLMLIEPDFSVAADGSTRKIAFRVGTIRKDASGKGFLGYRFEGPEGPGSHNFYHVQPIRGLNFHYPRTCVTWYPEKYPTFPLAAACDGELLLSVMVAFQGLNEVISHRSRRDSALKKQAHDLLARLAFRSA